MLIVGLHDGERIILDVSEDQTVKEVREMIQRTLNISVDQYQHDKKVLVLSWAGSDLQDPWMFSDLGIEPGSTIRVNLKEEVKPVLFLHCTYSQDVLPVVDYLQIGHLHLHEMRSLASRMTGLPVGVFRLVTKDGQEMYDGHLLEDYGVDRGHTIYLQNLDGWNEFINLAIMGFTPQVVSQISQEEITMRYQMKVALWMAAHYGHVDLARAMLRQGIRASEPIGYPPQRMWCSEGAHMDSRKAPVHQAVEMGQLGVLRLFVTTDITVITAKDGYGLAPLNIALRKKIRNCASFLLTKQWSKVNITRHFAVHVGMFTNLKDWCERAKERTFTKYGQSKSSLKRRLFQPAPLVGFGVHVDGFSPSIMTGKSKVQVHKVKDKEKKLICRHSQPQMTVGETIDPEAYFKQISAVQVLKAMGSKVKSDRWGRAPSKFNVISDAFSTARPPAATDTKGQRTEEWSTRTRDAAAGSSSDDTVTLPPIRNKLRHGLVTQSLDSLVSTSSDSAKDGAQSPPAGEKGSMMSRLMKSKSNAYFMAGGQHQQGAKVRNLPQPNGDRSKNASEAPDKPPDMTSLKRTQRGSFSTVSSTATMAGEEGEGEGLHPAGSYSHSATGRNLNATISKKDPVTSRGRGTTNDVAGRGGPTSDPESPAKTKKATRRKTKTRRVTSAFLLSKAASSEGTIPLPLISQEQSRRPFFYYNGQREDDLVEPAIATWSKHTAQAGATPRERAIRSLTVANTFKDKPWLGQFRIALRLAGNPTKRNVRRLRSASKRTLVV